MDYNIIVREVSTTVLQKFEKRLLKRGCYTRGIESNNTILLYIIVNNDRMAVTDLF